MIYNSLNLSLPGKVCYISWDQVRLHTCNPAVRKLRLPPKNCNSELYLDYMEKVQGHPGLYTQILGGRGELGR